MKIDNGYSNDSKPGRRFYVIRTVDETGISRTGRILEGVLLQSGKVVVEWRPPHSTIGIYNTFVEFELIHILCHPSCNEVHWVDDASGRLIVRYMKRIVRTACISCGAEIEVNAPTKWVLKCTVCGGRFDQVEPEKK